MKMCAALALAGHEVDLYAKVGVGAAGSPFEFYGVPETFRIVYAQRPPIRGLGAVLYARDVRRQMAGAGRTYDLLYARHLYSLAVAADRGDKLLYEAHAAPRHPVQRYSERQLFKHPKFARLVTISRVLADDYHALFPGLAANKTLVAHDGADEPERTASTVAMDTRRLRVGYVGQLYAGKGMEVISRMPVLLPELDFHVTGGSEADISEWKARLSAPNIHFHGFVPHAAVGEHIDRSDIVLAPYQEHVSVYGRSASVARWMSPLKLFEYMARGRAIVCSDLPVLREVLTHGVDALLVPPDNIEAWSAAIRRLASDSELRARLGSRARQRFIENFTWRARAVRVLEGLA